MVKSRLLGRGPTTALSIDRDYRVRLHASDHQIGIQKFERNFRINTFVHQVEARPGLCQ